MSSLYQENALYTYADFFSWDESFRAEIIDGEVFEMAPPSTDHQIISGELFGQLHAFLKGKPCQVFSAPFGVRLFPKADQSDDTVVEPDIVVVCDHSKLDKRGCNGAPDLIIEIISPSSGRYDRVVKFHKYQEAGVREYWIIDPELRIVDIHILNRGDYITTVYDETGEAPVTILPGCVIKLGEIFPAAL